MSLKQGSLLGGLRGREHSALVRPDTEHVFGQQSKLGESKLGSPSDSTVFDTAEEVTGRAASSNSR